LERAGQVTVDREQEWLTMATRDARVLYEVALLRSANPGYASTSGCGSAGRKPRPSGSG